MLDTGNHVTAGPGSDQQGAAIAKPAVRLHRMGTVDLMSMKEDVTHL